MLGTRDYVLHRRHGSILDQLRVGSCTGNALTGAINTEPIYRPRHVYREPMALRLYSLATALDGFPGVWKPDDTGSSGLAVCKAGVKLGLLTRYEHAFGIDEALDVLQVRPFITGIAWLEGCDRPNDRGVVRYDGAGTRRPRDRRTRLLPCAGAARVARPVRQLVVEGVGPRGLVLYDRPRLRQRARA
jgi:hypothetical protein